MAQRNPGPPTLHNNWPARPCQMHADSGPRGSALTHTGALVRRRAKRRRRISRAGILIRNLSRATRWPSRRRSLATGLIHDRWLAAPEASPGALSGRHGRRSCDALFCLTAAATTTPTTCSKWRRRGGGRPANEPTRPPSADHNGKTDRQDYRISVAAGRQNHNIE
jgi:hypothetical protein